MKFGVKKANLATLAALLAGMETPRLQQAKHATSAKQLVNWDWSVFKCSDTNVVFQKPFS